MILFQIEEVRRLAKALELTGRIPGFKGPCNRLIALGYFVQFVFFRRSCSINVNLLIGSDASHDRSVCREISLRLCEADGMGPDACIAVANAVSGGDVSQKGLLSALAYVLIQVSS